MTIIAVNLVALGVVVLAYSGIFSSPPAQPVNFPGMHFKPTQRQVIPPILGALALVGGIVLLRVNPSRAT